jgi:hypothetical protein
MVRDNRHESAYLFGAICPDRAIGAAMITPAANTEAMNLHLVEIRLRRMPMLCWFAMAPAGTKGARNCGCPTISPG